MKGDFTKFSFDPAKRYRKVLKQQGRVDVDADWNEYADIVDYLNLTAAKDVIGPCGAPESNAGFGITYDPEIKDLKISPGRIYVKGILCELGSETRYSTQPHYPNPPALTEPTAFLTYKGENELIKFERTVPAKVPRLEHFEVTTKVTPKLSLASVTATDTLPDGFQLVSGSLKAEWKELRVGATFTNRYTASISGPTGGTIAIEIEARRARESPAVLKALDVVLLCEDGVYRTDLVYLDVWQRHVTAIEDPEIREVALGGPDTSTRVQTVWQVKILTGVGAVDCERPITGWPPAPSGGRLTTQVVTTQPIEDPCIIPLGGGYRGPENRLYRVEVHSGGELGVAKFKWSRDNGSVVFPVESYIAPNKVKLKQVGRDDVLSVRAGDWVEILDDKVEYLGLGGTMAKVAAPVEESDRVLCLDRNIPTYDVSRHAKVRRWDQNRDIDENGLVTVTAGPTLLEDGVQVRFSGSNFKTSDYWTFAARTATADVDRLTDAPPQGIEHHYCRLALVIWELKAFELPRPEVGPSPQPVPGVPTVAVARRAELPVERPILEYRLIASVRDCRQIFPPLRKIQVWPTVVEVDWVNDQPMTMLKFNEGLTVTFSESMNSESANLSNFIVTLELPHFEAAPSPQPVPGAPTPAAAPAPPTPGPSPLVSGRRPFIVDGTIEVIDDERKWRFRPSRPLNLQDLDNWLDRSPDKYIRCRVTLKGNSIFDEKGIRQLDGDAFGMLGTTKGTDGKESDYTKLIFPSGNGERGGDFESWFYLVAGPLPPDWRSRLRVGPVVGVVVPPTEPSPIERRTPR